MQKINRVQVFEHVEVRASVTSGNDAVFKFSSQGEANMDPPTSKIPRSKFTYHRPGKYEVCKEMLLISVKHSLIVQFKPCVVRDHNVLLESYPRQIAFSNEKFFTGSRLKLRPVTPSQENINIGRRLRWLTIDMM